MESAKQYAKLIKPNFAPPDWLFGPVWSVLYVIIFISYSIVFYKVIIGDLPKIVALPFILNLLFNFLFTYFQFGLKNNILASLDIILILATLIWAMIAIYSYFPWVVFVNIPYLLWVSFATILQFSITYLNWSV
jgi:translocator protein